MRSFYGKLIEIGFAVRAKVYLAMTILCRYLCNLGPKVFSSSVEMIGGRKVYLCHFIAPTMFPGEGYGFVVGLGL